MHFIFYQTIFLYEILTLWNNANKYITVANMPNIAKLNGCFQIIKPPLLCCQILGFIFTRFREHRYNMLIDHIMEISICSPNIVQGVH